MAVKLLIYLIAGLGAGVGTGLDYVFKRACL